MSAAATFSMTAGVSDLCAVSTPKHKCTACHDTGYLLDEPCGFCDRAPGVSPARMPASPMQEPVDLRLLVAELEENAKLGVDDDRLRWKFDGEVMRLQLCEWKYDDLVEAAKVVLAGRPGAVEKLRDALAGGAWS